MTYADENEAIRLLKWLSRIVYAPRKLNKYHALFWFKASVEKEDGELWRNLVALQGLLNKYDQEVSVIRTVRPGYVVYEDEHQVAAVPFADTFETEEGPPMVRLMFLTISGPSWFLRRYWRLTVVGTCSAEREFPDAVTHHPQ
jgi:hypothetical protein